MLKLLQNFQHPEATQPAYPGDAEGALVEPEPEQEGLRGRRRQRRRHLDLQHRRRVHRHLHWHRPRHRHPDLRVLVLQEQEARKRNRLQLEEAAGEAGHAERAVQREKGRIRDRVQVSYIKTRKAFQGERREIKKERELRHGERGERSKRQRGRAIQRRKDID